MSSGRDEMMANWPKKCRNLDLVDAVIKMHDIARLVEKEVGEGNLSHDIRNCADRLHLLSIEEGRSNRLAEKIIEQAKVK
jgi:hypothetical protein